MISKFPSNLEISCIYEILHPLSCRLRETLRKAVLKGVGAGDMMHCQDLLLHSGSVFMKIVIFFLTDLCDRWKAAPRTSCSPFSTININMCMGPSAPPSLCVNEA